MKFALALLIAVHFWGDRGVHVPCHPVAIPGADAQMPVDGWGNTVAMAATTGCRVLISYMALGERRDEPELYCGSVVHEVGHLAGLGHTPTGVMSPKQNWDDLPWDCEHWKRFARRMHQP